MRRTMAETQIFSGGHPDMDYAEHERTYRFFVGLAKWSVLIVALILIFMAIFLL